MKIKEIIENLFIKDEVSFAVAYLVLLASLAVLYFLFLTKNPLFILTSTIIEKVNQDRKTPSSQAARAFLRYDYKKKKPKDEKEAELYRQSLYNRFLISLFLFLLTLCLTILLLLQPIEFPE